MVASLTPILAVVKTGHVFQSPSLRGSGRFAWRRGKEEVMEMSFNPLHCGAVVASVCRPAPLRRRRRRVSIPFIAGQWSLLAPRRMAEGQGGRFNPLHCGAVVASPRRRRKKRRSRGYVSIPFIAGQWSLLPRTTPSSLFGVLLRKRRLPCDHIICTRLPF